jgi:single-strand DNA-binding protein
MPVLDGEAANLSVLRGRCSAEPELRELSSGTRLASLSLRVPADGDRSTSVPVCIWDPPAWVDELEAGDELVVVGYVRRRFFRTGAGGAGSRVEVVAKHVVRATNRRRVQSTIKRARSMLDDLVA